MSPNKYKITGVSYFPIDDGKKQLKYLKKIKNLCGKEFLCVLAAQRPHTLQGTKVQYQN